MSYLINNKPYELETQLKYNILSVKLVDIDGDHVIIYEQDVSNTDGNPEWYYAGGGLFWSDIQWDDDGLNTAPAADAEKITPEEWAKKSAVDSVDALIEQECNFPYESDCVAKNDLVYEVSQFLTEQYRLIFAESAEQYAAGRLIEVGRPAKSDYQKEERPPGRAAPRFGPAPKR